MQITFDTVITITPNPITIGKSAIISLLIDIYRREEIDRYGKSQKKNNRRNNTLLNMLII